MPYTCSVCNQQVNGDLVYFRDHTDRHILDLVKHDHPEWVDTQGMCSACEEYYRNEINGGIFKDSACALRNRKIKSFWGSLKSFFGKH
ncbi:MAG: hypothetical protein KBD53_09650 [Candidatus Omnitrophica bacterium]|nr:hypothetical protein [Candidatus Omnitrophota bacterium]